MLKTSCTIHFQDVDLVNEVVDFLEERNVSFARIKFADNSLTFRQNKQKAKVVKEIKIEDGKITRDLLETQDVNGGHEALPKQLLLFNDEPFDVTEATNREVQIEEDEELEF